MGRKGLLLKVRVLGLAALPASARKPRLMEEAVRRAFAAAGRRAAGEITVVVVGRARMRAMNREFLGHDWDTDVIAFSHESPPGMPHAEAPLGDIVISAWQARLQARERGHPLLREVLTLAAHGALHLAGHDDDTPAKKARMFRLQDRALEGLGV